MTMNYAYSALAATIGLLAISSPAASTELGDTGFDLSSNIALTSDYTFRGITQTAGGPALQGGFDLSHESGFYAGNWNSSVEFDDASLEMDLYGGWAGSFSGFSVDVGAVYFFYPDTSVDDGDSYDYGEVYGTVGYDFGLASLSAGVNLTNEFFNETGQAQNYRTSVTVPISDVFSVGANVGYQAIDDNAKFGLPDYTHYGANVSASFAEYYTATLSGVGTDIDDDTCPDACDDRVELMLSAAF